MRQKKSYLEKLLISFIFVAHFFNCSIVQPSKKKDHTTLILASILFLIEDSYLCKNSRGEFWARNVVTNTSYCVKSDLVAESSNAKIYLERGLYTGLDYPSLLKTYDNQIVNREKEAFGPLPDIDKDGKIVILVLDIIDGATTNSGFVAGFFDPINFYADSADHSIRSNEKEILYMDGKELVELEAMSPGSFLSTVAHELQHLIRFQYEILANAEDDLWINEGTSEVASDITGFGPQTSRVSCYRGTSSSCSGGISGVSIFSWESALKNYAYAYSLMKYIYEISGSNSTQRNSFFNKTVIGNSSNVRANTASNLMEVFRSASSYNASVINPNSSNSDMFKRFLASFLGQSLGYSTITNTYFGDTNIVPSIDSVRTTYPLPSDLSGLYLYGGFSAGASGPTTSLAPSVVKRISGNTFGVTSGGSNFVVVKNNASDYLIFNGALSGSSSQTGTASLLESIEYPRLEMSGDELSPQCMRGHIGSVHKIEKQKLHLKLYRKNLLPLAGNSKSQELVD